MTEKELNGIEEIKEILNNLTRVIDKAREILTKLNKIKDVIELNINNMSEVN